MNSFITQPTFVFDKRLQLYNPTEFSVGELGEPIIQYELVHDSVWASIESQGNIRFASSEYVLGNHAKGKKVQIIRGHYRADISNLSKFVHGHRTFNIDKVDRHYDNNIFYFEAICLESAVPPNYVSDGTYFECYDQYCNPVVYQ